MDRRRFLQLGATAGATALLGVPARRAEASVPTGQFDLDDPSTAKFTRKPLNYAWTFWQGFAIDSNHSDHLFYVQQAPSGPGDLRLSYLHLDGSPNGGAYMDLQNFGHGQAIGVEYLSGDVWVWMETAAAAFGDGRVGTKICRFKWTEGQTGTYQVSDLGTSQMPGSTVFQLKPDSEANTCSICPVSRRLLLRYYHRQDGDNFPSGFYYTCYKSIDDVKVNKFNAERVFDWLPEPRLYPSGLGTHPPYQGHTIYGNYAYILSGSPYADCPGEGQGNIYITSMDMRTGDTSMQTHVVTRTDFAYREPEGMTMWMDGSTPKLCFGICSYPECGDKHKQMSLFYKNAIIAG